MKVIMTNQKLYQAAQSMDYAVWRDGFVHHDARMVANEKPVALSYNGTTHAVMMATPVDLEDFARGFSLTEGLITSLSDIESLTIVELENGLDVQIKLIKHHQEAFQKRRRHMAGPVGCGLCGMESIDAVMRDLPKLSDNGSFPAIAVAKATKALKEGQALNQYKKTGAMHAAGFYKNDTGLIMVREDVGRHNALDKLCGALMADNQQVTDGAVVVTSRLSVEMVQKTVMIGAPVLIAMAAPTFAAVTLGQESNLTLIARAREAEFEIYSGKDRISF